jgi:hypothetical protein
MAQLPGGQYREHVGLVLVGVDGAAQPSVREPCVMPGRDRVEPQGQSARGQRGELDSLVAPHARVRSLAAGIGRHEIIDYVFFELVREIPYVERDSEYVGNSTSVTGVLFRATAA